jgi:hypothetical protein
MTRIWRQGQHSLFARTETGVPPGPDHRHRRSGQVNGWPSGVPMPGDGCAVRSCLLRDVGAGRVIGGLGWGLVIGITAPP